MIIVDDGPRDSLIHAASLLLSEKPFLAVSLEEVAAKARVNIDDTVSFFPTMHSLGATVLDLERLSMHRVQHELASWADPLERVPRAFRLVGENLATDMAVRAGVRLAAEARGAFPERRLDPFGTWEAFVTSALESAIASGRCRLTVQIPRAVWLLVAAGMGARDFIAAREIWRDAPQILETTAADLMQLMVVPA